ncbi:alpha/beta hydrolase [Companilactobacillus suantsaicola]|uniref:Alpha/beta hydrolase n=1 Tax=Companilactobacillus suantsaicola TaxID=2487723 RepID=A0A4Z0JP40_9LACO|nr:alpha/beta hydrolase [Companilactobacillus suantsaicola]TGD23659.1 alpha/beta hydrolase [Companilactobacillus suantsaicola]
MKKAILYVHGKGGSAAEARRFGMDCPEYDVFGVDYQEYLPWVVEKLILEDYERLSRNYESVSLITNSIGTYFGMLALQDKPLKKALFISPILDMEKSITDSLQAENISETQLQKEAQITLKTGKEVSWRYLQFVREHPIDWQVPTSILYGEKDDHTSIETVNKFVSEHSCKLTVMPKGEHWFHTREQLAFLDKWTKKELQ